MLLFRLINILYTAIGKEKKKRPQPCCLLHSLSVRSLKKNGGFKVQYKPVLVKECLAQNLIFKLGLTQVPVRSQLDSTWMRFDIVSINFWSGWNNCRQVHPNFRWKWNNPGPGPVKAIPLTGVIQAYFMTRRFSLLSRVNTSCQIDYILNIWFHCCFSFQSRALDISIRKRITTREQQMIQ